MKLATKAIYQDTRALQAVAAVFAAGLTIALLAQIRFYTPFTPVPVTLQTLGVLLAGLVFGPRAGFLGAGLYLGAGVAGAPVFAGGQGGIGYMLAASEGLFAPTLGYLLAFPLAAYIVGALHTRSARRSLLTSLAASAVGASIILASGFCWLAVQYSLLVGVSSGVILAFVKGLLPFIVVESAKVMAATAIAGAYRMASGR